jgi:hypothetical protein
MAAVICIGNLRMKRYKQFISVFLFLFAFEAVMASNSNEYKIISISGGSSKPYLSLACINNEIRFYLQWNTRIGATGRYRRHLFLPDGLGDTHVLLQVLANQTRTGIVDNDQQAKSLIKLHLQNIKTERVYIEVFPEGRDSVTGEWERSIYEFSEFEEVTNTVAKECNWDIKNPIETMVRTVKPGAPYDDE